MWSEVSGVGAIEGKRAALVYTLLEPRRTGGMRWLGVTSGRVVKILFYFGHGAKIRCKIR